MAVAAHHDVDRRPAGADMADDMAQHQGHLGPVRRLAGAQDDRHRLAGGRLVDVDRLEAAAVVVGVEQRQLLAAVDPVLGVVDVEQDAPRHLLEAVAEHLDHRRHHALERGRTGQVLQPADGRLRAQIGAALGQPPDRHLEGGIGRGARRSRCRRDSPPRSAGRGSGSSRPACAAPVPARAGPRCNRPGARRSQAAARSPPAAISRRPRSSGRHRKRQCTGLPATGGKPGRIPVPSSMAGANSVGLRLIGFSNQIIHESNGLCRSRQPSSRSLDELFAASLPSISSAPPLH